MSRQFRQAVIGTIAAVMLVAGCGGPAASSTSATGSTILNTGGLVLEYPSGWTRFQYENVSSFSTLIAYLATVPVGDPCTRTANSMQCGSTPYELSPGTLVVEITATGGLNEIDLALMPLTIGGMPASFRVEPSGIEGRRLIWEIARSSVSAFSISADMRGPGLDVMQEQVTAMVEGLELNPPVEPLPDDPDELQAGAEAALAVALNALRINSPEVNCVPPVPGAARSATVVISGRPGPQEAVAVTCSSRVEASRLQMWKVVLTIRLVEPTSDLGTVVFTQWVTTEGQAGNTEVRTGP